MEPILVKPKITPQEALRRAQIQRGAVPANLPENSFNLIRKYEGFKPEPYKDSSGKWTIGIGTLIGKGSDSDLKSSPYYKKIINEPTAKSLAQTKITEKINLIKGLVGEDKFNEFSPDLQAHLVSGAYRGDITGSPKAIEFLKNQQFEQAAKEYLDNDEYRKAKAKKTGVAPRMEAAAAIIKNEKPKTFQNAVEDKFNQAFNSK